MTTPRPPYKRLEEKEGGLGENPPYILITQGVGATHIVGLMCYEHATDDYYMMESQGPFHTFKEAHERAERWARGTGLAIRV